jgi:colicin import membrane protein
VNISRSEPGLLLSAAVHLGLLGLLLVHFSREPKFEDAQEAVPVETMTDAQFSQVMKGEKTAKEVAPKPRADRVAAVEETKPTPATPQAQKEVPTLPPPLKHLLPDPSEAEDTPPTPPARPTPPPKPAPKPEPKSALKPPEPVEDKEEPEKADAEVIKPPPRPKPPEKKVETKPEPPKPAEKPLPKPPKLDEVAKLLSQNKDVKPNEKPSDKPAKPRSGEESNARPSPNLADISKLLSHEAAQSQGSAGREVSHTASLGTTTGHAAKMTPSMADALDGFLRERYKQCWNYLSFSDTPRYVPKIRIAFRQDGSLAATPVLLNSPPDAAAKALADSAMRAVRSCDPMKIPAQFAPFYDQWKDSTVAFNPQD